MKLKLALALFCATIFAGTALGQGQFSGGGGGNGNATSIQGTPVSSTAPSSTQCLVFGGTTWAPGSCSGSTNTAFSAITGSTNTTAAMVIGAGASLNFTSTGTINASTLGGATFAAPGAIGGTTAAAGAFTTLSATRQITSTQTTGTAPFVVASTTNVANLNASSLSGATFASPGAIGGSAASAGTFTTLTANTSLVINGGTALTTSNQQGTGNIVLATSPTLTTPVIGAATGTSLSVSGQLTSTVATGTAPLVVSSTTNVANLNASSLSGATFASPGAIGGTTAAAGTFTTLTATGTLTGNITGGGTQCVQVSNTGVFSGSGAVCGGTGLPTLPTSPNGIAQTVTSTPSGGVGVPAVWSLPGVPTRAVTGATSSDTISTADCAPGRVAYQGSAAVATALPTATTLGVSQCVFKLTNNTSGSATAVTVTPATWTINGSSTLAIAQGQFCTIYVDPAGTAWDADCADEPFQAGSNITITRGQFGPSISATGGGSSAFPETVTGGVSGAVACFTATTTFTAGTLLASNSPVLGGGVGACPKTAAGFTTDGTSILTLGLAGTSVGKTVYANATSGGITVAPPTGALGSSVNTFQAVTDTFVYRASTDTLTNKSIAASEINSGTLAVAQGGTNLASGTSGGVLCFTASGVIASSSALTSNVLTKGGGAGACPTNSLFTDTGTTVTYTGTGGIASPIFTATGTTAGFFDFPQGSTSAAVTPCNTAASACFQAPTAITSYVADVPGAAPTNNFSAWLFSDASPSIGTFAKMPQTAITSGTAYTNATTGFTSIVGGSGQTLSFAVEANTNYLMTCHVLWSASAATAGPKFQITGPGSPTSVQYAVMQAVTATSDGTAGAVAFSTSLNASGTTVVATTNEPAVVMMGLVNGATAGTVTVQAASQGTGTLTIQPGSYCQLQ